MASVSRARSIRARPSIPDGASLAPGAARAMVLKGIDQLVAAGIATLNARGDSSLELRFGADEVWRLDEKWITREK